MRSPAQIIEAAISKYKPVKCLLLISGGHDSVTMAHLCAGILSEKKFPFEVYHGDTTIGIPETQDYVKNICALYRWKLNIRKPPRQEDHYESIVAQYGFPGPTKSAHQYMYRRLKERALRHFVTHECKSTPTARENVLLFSGIRQQESRIRMGYKDLMSKEDSRCWVNPIFYMSEDECKSYMQAHNIPKNPVKEKMCISGECLCGAWAKREEWVELKNNYPEVAKRIERLQELAKANGFPWPWASGPKEWKDEQEKKKQLTINFMCKGCENKRPIV